MENYPEGCEYPVLKVGQYPLPKKQLMQLIDLSLIHILPGKRIYFIGEELDVSDMTLKVFYSNETSEIVPVKKDEVTGFNSTVPENDQILEVHKGSFTVTFKIQVLINDCLLYTSRCV